MSPRFKTNIEYEYIDCGLEDLNQSDVNSTPQSKTPKNLTSVRYLIN